MELSHLFSFPRKNRFSYFLLPIVRACATIGLRLGVIERVCMKLLHNWVVLLLIVILAATLRFYKLGEVPPSLNADEVAIGYNAYSILKTGKDEYNRKFPFLFQSFDDYKLPVYVYMTVPAIAVFGLSDFSIRFPSALFGTLTVLVTYFFVKELLFFPKNQEQRTKNVPLLSAAWLAISPWHLQFSRSAYEANVAVFFTVLGMTCLLKGVKQKWFYVIGFLSLALSVWSYHSSRLFVPLILVGFFILYFRDVIKNKLTFFIGTFLFLLACMPIAWLSFSSTGLVRARGVSALNDETLLKRNVAWRQRDVELHIPYSNMYHNHRFVNLGIMLKGYLEHYNPNFFFSEIVQNKYHAPGVGLLYLWELPMFLYGVYLAFRIKSRGTLLLLLWFLFAPLAASVTHMLPHPVRTLIFLPVPEVFVAMGLCGLCAYLGRMERIYARLYTVGMAIIIFLSCCYYFHQYYVHLPIDYALDWQYGHEQVVSEVRSLEDQFDTVVVSTSLDQPYIFFLYYLRYDPATYLAFGGTKSGKFDEEGNTFNKYEFHKYVKEETTVDPNSIYVGTPGELLPGTKAIKEVRDPSGNIVYVLYAAISRFE